MSRKALPPIGVLTQAKLKELLEYDPETGVFHWLPTPWRVEPGRVAGTVNREGYRRIQIGGRLYASSHLAWLYMTGELPTGQIDHRNRNTSDNRWANLREATQTENKGNSGVYRNNRLGVKGVRLHCNGRYEARLRVGGRLMYLGCFPTAEEAKARYEAAAREAFGEFAATG